ncbi:zeta toxin family protein [Leifsonia shinshuensis]
MSDDERERHLAAHRQTLAELTRPGGPIGAVAPAASVKNPAWYRQATGLARASRENALARILERYRASTPNVKRGKAAILLAGPPGSGKSSVLRTLLEREGTAQSEWRVLDADGFKDHLLLEAINDGSLSNHLTPDAVRDVEGRGERIWPRERAALVHEESSELMKRARATAIADGENIIVDGTMSNADSAKVLAAQLQQSGYSIKIAVVDAPRDVTIARTDYRWAQGYRQAVDGTAGDPLDRELGGRWVPEQVVDAMYDDPDTSSCRSSALAVAESSAAVTELSIYRVEKVDGAPELIERRIGRRPDGRWKKIERPDRAARVAAAIAQENSPTGRTAPQEGDSAAGGVPRCRVCGRPLRSAASIARGAGPTCAGEAAEHA